MSWRAHLMCVCLLLCNCSPVGTIPEQLGHCCCGHPQSHEARSRSSSGGEFICQRWTPKNSQHCCFLFKVAPLTVPQAVATVAFSRWVTACLRHSNLHGDSCSLWLRTQQAIRNNACCSNKLCDSWAFVWNLFKPINLQNCELNDRV